MGKILRQRKMKWRNYSADIISASLTMKVLNWSLEYLTKLGKVTICTLPYKTLSVLANLASHNDKNIESCHNFTELLEATNYCSL